MAKATPSQTRYQGLDFSFQNVLLELRHLKELTPDFIDSETSGDVLTPLINDLEAMRSKPPAHPVQWGIPAQRSLRTRVSEGKYEAAPRVGAHHVHAEISGYWELGVPRKSTRDVFRIERLASLEVRIIENSRGPITNWHFDIADAAACGCHFHTQISHGTIPIPRLPTFLLTPTDVIDFVLGELFQDEWERTVSVETDAARGWRRLQNSRLTKVLRWHQEQLASGAVGWTHLKRQKPLNADVFL
jgi:hypothetical protein